MTPSELKYQVEEAGTAPYFFDRKTMKFFGDTMSNYGCRSAIIDTYTRENVECWELYRKRKTPKGATGSAYFDKETLIHTVEKKEY